MIPLHDDNPTEHRPVVTVIIIVACVVVFLFQLSLGPEVGQALIFSLGVVPADLFGLAELPEPLALVPSEATIVTSMFLHGGLLHLAGNMLYLWVFGNNVEDAMGRFRFVIFYLLCGAVAVMAQALPAPDSVLPIIGASGAISGVLGAYLMLYPRARVLVVIPIFIYPYMVKLSAALVLVIWILFQAVNAFFSPSDQGGVAFAAHVGGFVAGLVLVLFFRRPGVTLFKSEQETRSRRP